MPEEAKGITFTISGVKERIAIYGFAILIGSTTIADILVPKRPDPFTGTEGAAHDDRLDVLEMEHSLFRRSLSDCKEHRDRLESTVSSLVISSAKLARDSIHNKYLIERCMNITGN